MMYERGIDDYYTLLDAPDVGQSVECTAKAGPADHVFLSYRLRLPSDDESRDGSIPLGSQMVKAEQGGLAAFSEDVFQEVAADFMPEIPQEAVGLFSIDSDLSDIAQWYEREEKDNPAVGLLPFREVVRRADEAAGIDRSGYIHDLAETGRMLGYDFNYADLEPSEAQDAPFGLDLEVAMGMLEDGYDLYDPVAGTYLMSYLTDDEEPGLYVIDVPLESFMFEPVGPDEVEPMPWEIASEAGIGQEVPVIPANDGIAFETEVSAHIGNLVIATVPDGHYGAFLSACREIREIERRRDEGIPVAVQERYAQDKDASLGDGAYDPIAGAYEAASLLEPQEDHMYEMDAR